MGTLPTSKLAAIFKQVTFFSLQNSKLIYHSESSRHTHVSLGDIVVALCNYNNSIAGTFRRQTPLTLAGQEARVRTGHGTTGWFQIGKGVCQGCILSLCLFNLYAEYIMRNARLEEAQAGIKIAGRNINNFRYADATTLMAESEEEL